MTEQDNTVWSGMLAHLRQHHPAICRQWFADLEPCGVAGGTLQLRAKSPLYRDYLRRECNDPFGDAARSVTGRLLTVRFLGPDDDVLAPPPPPKRATPIGEPPRSVLFTKPSVTPPIVPANAQPATPQRTRDGGAEETQKDKHNSPVGHDDGPAGNISHGTQGNPPRITTAATPVHTANGASLNGHAPVAPRPGTQPSQDESAAPSMPRVPIPEPRIPLEPTFRADALIEHKGTPRDQSRDDARDHSRDAARDQARDHSRDAARDQQRDQSRDQSRDQARDQPREQRRSQGPSRYESLVVNPDFCFENFVQCPGNRMALAAAQAIATTPGRVYNPFFLYAAVGLGKTHLLQAICLRIAETNPRAMMYYTSCEGFVTQFFESVKDGEMSDFRQRFRDIDVLVIDDIHFLSKRESSQEEFFHTFNALYHSQKQIILSCDAAPEDIPDIEDRLVSRFKWGLVTKIEPPIFETRVAILKTKAEIRGLAMPDDVAMFIASKLSRSIRELEGAVVKLHIQSAVEKRPIDLEMAKEALGEALIQPKGEPTLQAIISAVTEFYGVRLTDLQSKGRQRSIALPRQVCMYLARRCTRHSLEEIGGFFGGRDHTTVMHAVETIDQRRNADSELDLLLRSLEDRVRNSRTS